MTANYILDIVILLVAAVVAVPLFRAVGLGAVPGFLVAGVVVGPSGMSLIDNVTEISRLSELGVVLLLFIIGIELKPSRLRLMRRLVFGLGTVQVVITGSILAALVYYVFDVSARAAILVGPALALSSTAFVLQILAEQKLLNSRQGRASLAVLLTRNKISPRSVNFTALPIKLVSTCLSRPASAMTRASAFSDTAQSNSTPLLCALSANT